MILEYTNRLPTIYTVAPLCSKVAAIINPIPVPPPVTTATNPDGTMTMLSHLVGLLTQALTFCREYIQ